MDLIEFGPIDVRPEPGDKKVTSLAQAMCLAVLIKPGDRKVSDAVDAVEEATTYVELSDHRRAEDVLRRFTRDELRACRALLELLDPAYLRRVLMGRRAGNGPLRTVYRRR